MHTTICQTVFSSVSRWRIILCFCWTSVLALLLMIRWRSGRPVKRSPSLLVKWLTFWNLNFLLLLFPWVLVWKSISRPGSPSFPWAGSPRGILPRGARHVTLEACYIGISGPGEPDIPVESGPAYEHRGEVPPSGRPSWPRLSLDSARRRSGSAAGAWSPPPTLRRQLLLRRRPCSLLLRIRWFPSPRSLASSCPQARVPPLLTSFLVHLVEENSRPGPRGDPGVGSTEQAIWYARSSPFSLTPPRSTLVTGKANSDVPYFVDFQCLGRDFQLRMYHLLCILITIVTEKHCWFAFVHQLSRSPIIQVQDLINSRRLFLLLVQK